jgi:AcrR family transcriptional regulator
MATYSAERPARRPAKTRRASRGRVSEFQRNRLLAATLVALQEVGYQQLTVAHIIRHARVSRKTFYDAFDDRESCVLAVFKEAVDHTSAVAREGYSSESSWRECTRAALTRLLMFMDAEPALARLCVVDTVAGGDAVVKYRRARLEDIVRVIDRGRDVSPDPPHDVASEAVLGAVLAVLHNRIVAGDTQQPLLTLLGPLMSMIVLPFLGARAAAAELHRPGVPADPAAAPSKHADPLAGLEMRVTYRTIRVLGAIAASPGASNCDIGEASDVRDAGQISKLLSRLVRLDLAENRGKGAPQGVANEWYLTRRGAGVERATRAHQLPGQSAPVV